MTKEDAIRELEVYCAQLSFYDYCRLRIPKLYEGVNYLKELCDTMQEFLSDDNELLIINIPPRHAKSLTATQFTQWALGVDPMLKLIMASYNEKLSRKFSKSVRNAIQEVKVNNSRIVYSDIFPGTKIERGSASVDFWKVEGSPVENYLATSPGATVTGVGGDIIIIDDIVKNAYEAYNREILDGHFEWFTDTLYSRLEGLSKIILIMTRWATKDLAGRLIDLYTEQGRKFKVITKRAFDGKAMLNPEILPYDRYQNLIQTIGEDIVEANYNQTPVDLKGALYGKFQTYAKKPNFEVIQALCDTADTGEDFLCNIIYGIADCKAYVIDVYYTQDAMEVTENELARRLTAFGVENFWSESNFGGKAFGRNVKRIAEDMGNETTSFRSYTQTLNKEARIYSNSTNVMRRIIMPEDWRIAWPKFYHDVTDFQRQGENPHDDAPDVLTAIVERERDFI